MRADPLRVWNVPVLAEPHARPRRGANARSLLRTVVGEYMLVAGRWTWTQTLVHGLGLFGFDGATVRQALIRSAKEEWLERKRSGRRVRWRLSKMGWETTTDAHARVYRFASGRADWNGRWLLLVVSTPDERTRVLLRRRLGWVGFAVLPSGQAMISPHQEREAEARRVLALLGLGEDAVSFAALAGSIGVPRRMIAAAWDLADLQHRYRAFVNQIKAMRPQSDRDVFVAHTKLIHEWRRFPYVDPGLPLEYLPAGWIGSEAKRLFDDRYARWQPRAAQWFRGLDEDGDRDNP